MSLVPDLIHRAAYEAAEETPDAAVFAMPGATLTFGELVDQASRLALVLTEHGVRRGDRVALYFQKSLESAIAIYAIMQAGAAYVPLDPAAPTERTKAVIQQCGARVLITHKPQQAKVASLLPAGLTAVIGLDQLDCTTTACVPWSQAMAAPPGPGFVSGASELDLAYIIFTSGSTGVPKGIMHTHRSGLSYSRMAGALYNVSSHDRLASLSPLHFDMSTFDYLCGPQHGAMTMIVPDPYMKLPASLSELVQDEALTIWYSVPFALTQMLLYGAMEDHDLTSLRWVLFGGEPFAPKHLAALTERLPHATFSNVYGPAEVNQCTYYHLPPRWKESDGQPPIGVACANTDVQVVNDDFDAVPTNETGELIVRSPSVMRGYWERHELNARAFLRRRGPGGVKDIWLRTGDLARLNGNGLLSFHGRVDRQVKVRGYRVELDEVEDVLTGNPAVEEASAYPVHVNDTLTVIHAAVTASPGATAVTDALLNDARAKLPSYAVPERLSIVKTFPRTSSGKIDWKSLSTAAEEQLLNEGKTNASGD